MQRTAKAAADLRRWVKGNVMKQILMIIVFALLGTFPLFASIQDMIDASTQIDTETTSTEDPDVLMVDTLYLHPTSINPYLLLTEYVDRVTGAPVQSQELSTGDELAMGFPDTYDHSQVVSWAASKGYVIRYQIITTPTYYLLGLTNSPTASSLREMEAVFSQEFGDDDTTWVERNYSIFLDPPRGGGLWDYAVGGVDPIFTKSSNAFEYVHQQRNDDPTLNYIIQVRTNLTEGAWITVSLESTTTVLGGVYDKITHSIPATNDQTYVRLLIEDD